MELKEQIFGYLQDIEEYKAAEIVRESEFKGLYEQSVYLDLDEWDIYSYQILIKGKFLKNIESEFKEEKKLIEKTLSKFAEIEKQSVRFFSWLPLPRIYSEISKFNQNDKMKQCLIDNDFDTLFTDIKSIFASLSYQMKVTEAYFHSNIHVLLKTIGFDIVSEDETNHGRIDSVLELDDKILIIEFKTSSAKIALAQIKSKAYYEKYLIKDKEIILIGVSCSVKEKNIKEWQVEKYNA
jgi:hypothetical protein